MLQHFITREGALLIFSDNDTNRTTITFRGGAMHVLVNKTRQFFADEEGAALAEYGVLVAFIAIVAITAVTFFGSKVSSKFSALATTFT